MFEYIWILLPLGLIIGWFAAKLDLSRKQKLYQYLSLRYFLENEKKKSSVDALSVLPLNSEDEGVNFTLLLGDAFRRRGEIDKAIELHEFVLTSEDIDPQLKPKIINSLSEDYMAGGFLDRSEETLRKLLMYDDYKNDAAIKLAQLFKQQQDWLQAVGMYERVDHYQDLYAEEVAHLYCELSEKAIEEKDDKALFWADEALKIVPIHARAHLIKSYIAFHQKDFIKTIEYLKSIELNQRHLVPIILPIMYQSMNQLDADLFEEWLTLNLKAEKVHFKLHLWQAHLLVLHKSIQEGVNYLKIVLEKHHNLMGIILLNKLQEIKLTSEKEPYILYDHIFNSLFDHYTQFRCEKCGFVSTALQWNCPSCLSWNTIAPVSDIIALRK